MELGRSCLMGNVPIFIFFSLTGITPWAQAFVILVGSTLIAWSESIPREVEEARAERARQEFLESMGLREEQL